MRKISHNTYLQALGLFTLAKNHAKKAEEFEAALTEILDLAPYGYMSDAIYDGAERDFDNALRLEEIEVERN
jgi:hypothetical protein